MPEEPINPEDFDPESMSEPVEPPPPAEEELPLPLQIAEEEPPPLPKSVEPETPSYYSGADTWTSVPDPFEVSPEPAPSPLPASPLPSPTYSTPSDVSSLAPSGSPSNNKTMIIIIVAVLLFILCCCCVVVGGAVWAMWDDIVYQLDLNMMQGFQALRLF